MLADNLFSWTVYVDAFASLLIPESSHEHAARPEPFTNDPTRLERTDVRRSVRHAYHHAGPPWR